MLVEREEDDERFFVVEEEEGDLTVEKFKLFTTGFKHLSTFGMQ